ncbi:MAG: hypothetical protein COA58_08405 [Bacteroidetes bacterium]|nr:MAG: hypothetical protein COA58_08405 [Bacteroidota bacterium]
MKDQVNFKPNWTSSPGSTIIDLMRLKSISTQILSHKTGWTFEFTSRLLRSEVTIDNEVSKHLAIHLGGSTNFWLEREANYRNKISGIDRLTQIEWLKKLPLKDMFKHNWIRESNNPFQECLDFFNVKNIHEWSKHYVLNTSNISFRTSQAYQTNEFSLSTWLRQGEKECEALSCKPFNKELFELALQEIKKLTRKKNPSVFISELKKICSECGVAVAVVPTPKGCTESGATRFIKPDKAMILLSFRYKSDDQFWFTFFHEAGHIFLHKKDNFIIERKIEQSINEQEDEANLFAQEVLIPNEFHKELRTLNSNKRKIIAFASKLGISPGIVVGQMQYFGIIKPGYLNSYKRFFSLDS